MPETSAVRAIARRVKTKALEQAEFILENPHKVDKELYNETYLTVLKNSVPRTQEITGDDGEALQIKIVKYGDNTEQVPAESVPNTPS